MPAASVVICETCHAAPATHTVRFQSDHAGGMYGSRPEARCADCVRLARQSVVGTRATQVLASPLGAPEAPECWASRREWDAYAAALATWQAAAVAEGR